MQKRADSNESFTRGFGKADFYVAGDPNVNGGRGIRTIVTASDGAKMKRQVGGRPPKSVGSTLVRPNQPPISGTASALGNLRV
jgi:hypothetical protein